MPAWPNLSDQEVSDLAYFLTTFSPDFTNPERRRPAGGASERAGSHGRVHRAREEAVRGDRLPEVPRQPRSGRRAVGADADGRLRPADTRGRPRAPLDLPGRADTRGHLPDDEHGVQRHADAVVHRQPLGRATLGDHRLHRLALEERRAWLYQPRRRQAVPGCDRSDEGGRTLRVRSCRPLPDHRTDHRAAARVPSAHHFRDRSGHLRYRIDCPARSLARHGLGEDGNERADRFPCRRRRRRRRVAARRRRRAVSAIWKSPSRQPRIPLPRRTHRRPARPPSSPTPSSIQIPSRCRPAPASPTSSSATARTPWISGSSIWPAPEPLQFTGRGSADVAPNDTGDVTGVASYDQGEWSVIFKRPLRASAGAPFAPGAFLPIAFSVWDGFSRERGNRRGLTSWYSLYLEPEVVTSAVGPMVRTGLLILVIELAMVGWVRWRHGSRARGELGGEPSHPAATRA